MTPAEVLRKAADVIRERGWHQGDFEREPGGPCCVLGAIRVVISAPLTHQDALRPIELLEDAVGQHWLDSWNDDEERTADEVIAALEKAAELAESK